uniref:Uncharacterized protein n=1 Tax=Candidatus Kentrum sp. LPFa TaxID=2126335 RepID=A0A450WDT2_9GAMM|nr:MAG: hypothetical protein BECKLPF1236B_GA0070989_107314 [Candidatus Kentron sp. LPFa]
MPASGLNFLEHLQQPLSSCLKCFYRNPVYRMKSNGRTVHEFRPAPVRARQNRVWSRRTRAKTRAGQETGAPEPIFPSLPPRYRTPHSLGAPVGVGEGFCVATNIMPPGYAVSLQCFSISRPGPHDREHTPAPKGQASPARFHAPRGSNRPSRADGSWPRGLFFRDGPRPSPESP